MKTLFNLCELRDDVRTGVARESDFAADLAQVLDGVAPNEYKRADVFFANTHPTDGLKRLLENVCLRLSGKGGEAASIFRLDTQYGGGKTHALIALTHLANGMSGVANIAEFIDPALVPTGKVRIAAFDGENADPVNGRPLGQGLRAHTPWGEIAYRLAGVEGYERVRLSDTEERTAPGADTIRELFGEDPTLILMDELSIYLRKVRGRPEADQLTPFLSGLFKAVESTPRAALVFTLAIGKGGQATDAYAAENEFVARQMDEADSVAARKATVIDPTSEHETAQILRRRLFKPIDDAGASEVVEAYRQLWSTTAGLAPSPAGEDRADRFTKGYPLHPALMDALTDKLSTLGNFQRVRGMLRLLTQGVAKLWDDQPTDTYAVHLHHLDPGHPAIRNEVLTRLELSAFAPAIDNDVANTSKSALAQELDAKHYVGLASYGSFVARTILWHTFAFNEQLKGLTGQEINYSVLGPGLDVGFIDDARQRFVAESGYLDDRPGSNLRFLTEANLEQLVRRQAQQVDPSEMRAELQDRIRKVFEGKDLEMVPFPSVPNELPDDVGSGAPYLAVISYDAEVVEPDAVSVPGLVERLFQTKGQQGDYRSLVNNVVFVVADRRGREEMRNSMTRRLALEAMRHPDRIADLAEHQQDKIREWHQRAEHNVAVAIQQCYRHLFFPSRNNRLQDGMDLAHASVDAADAAERPGIGQQQVLRALRNNSKLLRAEDHPLAPEYVRDQTVLKNGQATTAELRNEFRKDPRLPIMLGDENFVTMIRAGVDRGVFVYKSGDLLLGPGDAWADVKVDQRSVIYTMAYATKQGIWPRKAAPEPGPGPGGEEGEGTGGEGRGLEPPPAGAQTFTAEAPLREALTRIWEDARKADVARIDMLSLRLFDATDAFRLLAVVGREPGAQKKVRIKADYETGEGSTMELEFDGTPSDAEPARQFLEPQLRAATDKRMDTTYSLTFTDGLALAGKAPEELTERLARFASGAAFVEARAEASQEAGQ